MQLAPSMLSFDRGTERIAGIRLTDKGLYRWFATCCQTPLGNTAPGVPFVGMHRRSFPNDADVQLGPPRAAILGKFAIGRNPGSGILATGQMLAHVARLLIEWKLRGQGWPHPFFERDSGLARYPVTTLTTSEREALRPRCGPRPTAS